MGRKIIFIILLFLFCAKEKESSFKFPEDPPDEIINNFSMIELENEKKLYSIRSKKAYIYDSKDMLIVFSPFINFYDKNQSLIATVKTDTGIIFQKTGKFHARGNVVINTIDNTKLYTDTLLWDNERKLIITDGYVEVYTSTGKITAVGMESDAFLKKITFKKDIKGETNIVPQ